jgi:polyphosphate kinase
VDLWVRGICCLRPGLKGLSEHIRVVSVVDRFLEHSRIFCFHAGGEWRVYLSSADWMPRNFYSRMEVAFPLRDPGLARYVRSVILANGFKDNVKSWNLLPDATYERVVRKEGEPPVRSQFLFEALSIRRDLDDMAQADEHDRSGGRTAA